MPYDAILVFAFSIVVFLYSMLNAFYENDLKTLLVLVIYSIVATMSLLVGWFIIKALNRRVEE